ncbi:MAG: hypothetical protein KatS3mg124_1528 [Porticoccaceae bacterium]|nr:MAG: hypothetical protein KatS3mg124_1528 [Porticoccaceae bacterium]
MRHGAGAGGDRRHPPHRVCLPDAPGGGSGPPRPLPHLRHGTGAAHRLPRGGGKPGTEGHDPTLLGLLDPHPAGAGAGDGAALRTRSACRGPAACPVPRRAAVRHPGGAVGRLAFLRARRKVGRRPPSQHVHADRAGRGGRLCLQRGGRPVAADLPPGLPRRARRGGRLLRGGGGDRHPGAAGTGAGAQGPQPDQCRDQGPAGAGPQDGAAPEGGRHGGGHPPGSGPGGRPPAGAPRREGAGGRLRWRKATRRWTNR